MTLRFERLDDTHFVVMVDGVPRCVHENVGAVEVATTVIGED